MRPNAHYHIEVMNVSNVNKMYCRRSIDDNGHEKDIRELKYFWAEELSEIVEGVAKTVTELPESQITCFFPHDPSVPIKENPTVFAKVSYVEHSPTPIQLKQLKQELTTSISDFMKELRGEERVRVVVAIGRFY